MTIRRLVTKNAVASFLLSAVLTVPVAAFFWEYIAGWFKKTFMVPSSGTMSQSDAYAGFYTDLYALISLLALAPLVTWLIFRTISLINYKKHPSYKKFSLLPENAAENERIINLRLAELRSIGEKPGKIINIEGWEIERGLFFTRISIAEPKKRSYE